MIRKVGSQYCVFSKDGTKKLGCYPTEAGAKKRLQQVEYFKHVKGGKDMSSNFYPNAFGEESDNSKHGTPLDLGHRRLSSVGTLAGQPHKKVLDTREHYPIHSENQAKSAIRRVGLLSEIPGWFSGSIDELQTAVFIAVSEKYPELAVSLEVSLEHAMASLTVDKAESKTPAIKEKVEAATETKSDLAEAAESVKVSVVKDPVVLSGVKSKVPSVTTPNLKNIAAEFETAVAADKSIADSLVQTLEKQKERLDMAMKLAKQLMNKGLNSEQFGLLCSYLQEDILRALMSCASTRASAAFVKAARNLNK